MREAIYQACLQVFNQMTDEEIKGMSCFFANWKAQPKESG